MTTSYRIDPETDQRIENIFTHHPPFGDQNDRYTLLRDHAKALAYLVVSLTPKSREQSLALTHLEEVVFFANTAIARHETPPITQLSKYEGCYGGHDPNELPDSEAAGGDPLVRRDILVPVLPSQSLPGTTGLSDFPDLKPIPKRNREPNVIPA